MEIYKAQNGLYGSVNETGEIVIPFIFDEIIDVKQHIFFYYPWTFRKVWLCLPLLYHNSE